MFISAFTKWTKLEGLGPIKLRGEVTGEDKYLGVILDPRERIKSGDSVDAKQTHLRIHMGLKPDMMYWHIPNEG